MKRPQLTGLITLALLLLAAGPAAAQIDAELIASGKAATGLVLRPSNEGSGTAFCIDKRGYFITNEHVVAGIEDKPLTIVMNPASDNEYELQAKIVDIDRDNDLALIKAELGEREPGVLQIGGDQPPIETSQLIAFGFPFGELLAFNGDYPAVSVNLGRVTSLRKKDGQIRAIQTDTALNFGNSGGPMLDTKGKVAGVVIAGLPGTGINFAIPAATVNRFLSKPRIAFEPPKPIAYADRNKPLELSITLDAFSPGDKPYEVTVEIELDGNKQSVAATRNAEGAYTARIVSGTAPAPVEDTDGHVEIEAGFEQGRIACRVKDLQLQLDKTTLMLSEILLLDHRKAEVRIVKRDGSEITGEQLAVQAVNADLGGATVRLDLGKTQWLRIKQPELGPAATGYTAPLTVRVAQGGKTLAEDQATLQIMDPLARGDLDLPGGFDTDDPDLPGNALVFDARRDKKLTGWKSSVELPEPVDGSITIQGKGTVELAFQKDIKLSRMTIEYETTARTAFMIFYGDTAYRVHIADNWIGILDADGNKERPDVRSHATVSGRKKVTIAIPAPGVTAMEVDGTSISRSMKSTGPIRILIESNHPFKLHRIELVPQNPNDPNLVVEASSKTPPVTAATVEQDESEVKLAGEYQSFEVGGGGRYMLFHVPGRDMIQIVDVVKGGIAHTIDQVSDDVMIAAGLEHFVLVLPGQKILQRWSYAGFKREKVARMPGEGQPWRVLLGASSTGPMVLCATGNLFIDLESMRESDVDGQFWPHRPQHVVEVSADGRVFMCQGSPGRNSPLFLNRLEGDFVWATQFNSREGTRQLLPTADGRLIFTNREVFDLALNPLSTDWLRDLNCYPTVDPRYFVAVRQIVTNQRKNTRAIQFKICTVADRRVIYTETGLPHLSVKPAENQRMDINAALRDWRPHCHYVPWAKAMVTIGWDKATVRIQRFDLIEKLASKGDGYLFVQSAPPVFAPKGGRLAYQVDVVSSAEGLTYELLDGPDGVSVSADGMLSWAIPDSPERKKETIILSIRNSAGEEILHSFDLTYQ